ncbi:MAG: BrnT family toxin [Chloroflexia bacterium]|jgi:uncharacterized DUF497 family protein|nr:BrnT family toxin [Chloroflexia bacterium]
MSDRPPRIDALDWDDWNRAHIAKHQVTPAEVEEVVVGDAIARASYKNRVAVIGLTGTGRMLTVIIGESPHQRHLYYVFSARPASRVERGEYRAAKGGGTP